MGFGAERAWRWGAGLFMQVKELIEEEITGQGNIRENEKINYRLATLADYCSSGEIDRRSFHE